MNTYIANIDIVGSEMERPFMRQYVNAATPDRAKVEAARYIDEGEAVRSVEPLQPILDRVRASIVEGGRWSIDWKHEGSAGPVTLTDLDAAPSGVTMIPFGSDPDWSISLPWSSRSEAKRLAKYLGLTLGDS
jgi:hypothetical protein